MANQLTILDITQAQFEAAEQAAISAIRAQYPQLDLRKGTVLRDLLIRPDAILSSLNTARVAQLQSLISLATLAENSAATPADVNAILANFNMTQQTATYASGTLKITVSALNTYTVGAGFLFQNIAGLQYAVTTTIVATTSPIASLGQVALQIAADGSYFFLVPVIATSAGSASNVSQGTAFTNITQLYGCVSASAYTDITSGTDGETIQAAINRIPAAVSHRGLVNTTAVTAQLSSYFSGTVSINAVSVQGYGSSAMLRDKHNVFGVAVGGRADVYVRTFTAPSVFVLQKTGTLVAANTYQFTIAAGDAPGFYAMQTITDATGIGLSSYNYTEVRTGSGLNSTWHDISSTNPAESAFSVFQASTVTVTGVPDNAAMHAFTAYIYVAPNLSDIQAYMDNTAVRNVAADFLARSPLMCLTTCNATVYYPKANSISIPNLQSAVAAYINGRSFVARLTRSELAAVLFENGVSRIDMGPNGMKLQGTILDAKGMWHTLSGDALDVTSIADGTALLTPDTVVFAAPLANIQLIGVGE